MLTIAPVPPTECLFPRGVFRDLYIVAHQDDDLLFMNPDIQTSISLGHVVRTIYLTAGDSGRDVSFWRDQREAGVMAAYAEMAGVADEWMPIRTKVLEIVLTGNPRISLSFMRLPTTLNEVGRDCPGRPHQHVPGLWRGMTPEIAAVDGSRRYTRSDLVDELSGLIASFRPSRVSTLDSSGVNADLKYIGDPSTARIRYPGGAYIHDHCEHYYVALFALAACRLYRAPLEFRRYRGYNTANDAVNVSGPQLSRKLATFMAYATFDSSMLVDGRLGGYYGDWMARQYLQQCPAIGDWQMHGDAL